jgi:histidine decarboxylase
MPDRQPKFLSFNIRFVEMIESADSSISTSLPRNVLDTLFETELRIRRANATHMGYPYNLQPQPRLPPTLASFLINNLGDPNAGSGFAAEVFELERQVIVWLSKVWGGSDSDLHAGSVGAGGTESNIWAIYLGREAQPDAVLLHSADAHYSVPKAGRLLRVETHEVASTAMGEIDLADLGRVLGLLQGRPVILALTCGTTIKGAHDDIAGAIAVLDQAGIGPDRRFVHIDGSLSAMVVPFLPSAPSQIRPSFRLGVDSIATSGHTMIGTAMPCGALISRKTHLDRISRTTTSLRAIDTTLMGARNGHAVLAMWARLMTQGVAGFTNDAMRCTLRAADLAASLRAVGVKVLLNPHSMTVVFPQPNEEIVKTYQLACHRGMAHAIIMPSVTDGLIDQFISEYCDWFRTAGV